MCKLGVKCLKLFVVLLIQLVVSACNWPSYTKVLSGFTDDPGFDRNLESNQISRLSVLSYYWPQTTLMLQCLAPNNTWISLAGSEVTRNLDRSLRDFNVNAPGRAVYHHYWSGDQVRHMASQCRIHESVASTLKTDHWAYTHKQKALTLRVVQSDEVVLPAYSDAERECFGSRQTSDMWQRHSECNDPSNDASFDQPIDESISRVPNSIRSVNETASQSSNYTRFRVLLNDQYSSGDGWYCSYKIRVDGVSKGYYGSPVENNIVVSLGDIAYGAHTIGLTVHQCQFRSACLPPRVCNATNTVHALGLGKALRFVANPHYKAEQAFSFTVDKPI